MENKTVIRPVIVHKTTHCDENTWDSVVTEKHYSLSVKRNQSKKRKKKKVGWGCSKPLSSNLSIRKADLVGWGESGEKA